MPVDSLILENGSLVQKLFLFELSVENDLRYLEALHSNGELFLILPDVFDKQLKLFVLLFDDFELADQLVSLLVDLGDLVVFFDVLVKHSTSVTVFFLVFKLLSVRFDHF